MATRHKVELILICVVCYVLGHNNGVVGTKTLQMEDYCDDEISMILTSLYQARIELSTSSSCDAHIEAWYNKPRIMFYFEHLELDCDDGYLDFYDDVEKKSTPVAGELIRLCGDTKPSGVYTTESRNLRIRYTRKRSAFQEDMFKIIVTAFSDGACSRNAYECDNGRCIDKEVSCNDLNSCGDDSASCGLQLSTYTILRIAGGCVAFIGFIIAMVVCIRRIRRGKRPNPLHGTPPVAYTPNQTQQVVMPTQDGAETKGQFAYGAPPPGQSPYYPGQPSGYAPPPGQPIGYAPPPGQPSGYAPPPGQPSDFTPPPGQPSYPVPPPAYTGLYPQGVSPYPTAAPADHESKEGLLSSYPPKP